MSIKITDERINCFACEPECPNHAIYERGVEWRFSDGTSIKGMFTSKSVLTVNADALQVPKSHEVYYIVSDKYTEYVGFLGEPQCAAFCNVDCFVDDENLRESKEELMTKKDTLHLVI
jgi:ferredoxin